MNEIRDLIVGIDFGKEYSQICYYDRKGDEARSLSMKAGGNQYEAPCILCWRPEQKDYCVGLEADYFVREKGGVMIDDVYGICEKVILCWWKDRNLHHGRSWLSFCRECLNFWEWQNWSKILNAWR